MSTLPCIALIAHDLKKDEMAEFARRHQAALSKFRIVATGTTGGRVLEAAPNLDVTRLKSGPLGGDQQIGAMIAANELDLVLFLRDPLTAQPHEPDVSALLRLCDVQKIPLATNVSSAIIMLEAIKNKIYFN